MNIYIHYPYCATLCPYCDFFSTTAEEDPAYQKALLEELRLWSRHLSGPVTTVYFGGGTPGRMDPLFCARVLAQIDSLFGFAGEPEITLEANPDDITQAGVAAFLAAGINRLSLGIQSLDDENLRFLGRRHDAAAGRAAVAAGRAAGVKNLSLDLIFGLPGQTATALAVDLDAIFGLGSEHVSLYGLTIESGTRFGKDLELGRFDELDRDSWLAMYQQVADAAQRAGMHRYEIANFARPGFSSRHNRGYWRDRSFVGVGPGAHGQRHLGDGVLERRCNPRSIRGWIDQVGNWAQESGFLDAASEAERLAPARWLREAAMVGLRDLDLGIDPVAWGEQLGLADPPLYAMIERFSREGILSKNPPFRVQGRAVDRIDAVAAELLNA